MSSNYFNLLKHIWTLEYENEITKEKKSYRINVGINNELPDGLEKKFKNMLSLLSTDAKSENKIELKQEIKPVTIQKNDIKISDEDITIIMTPMNESSTCFSEIINQLLNTNYDKNKLHFIFIDNNIVEKEYLYTEKIVSKVRKIFPDTKLIRNRNNKMLSGAMNLALINCETKMFVYVCTRHTYIYDNNWLKDIISKMPDIKTGYVIGGTLSRETGLHVQGGAFIAYTEIIKRISYDMEKFPMVFMDVDLCKRIVHHGYKLFEIDNMLSKMSGFPLTEHHKNLQTKKYKIVHSHEIIEYRKNSIKDDKKYPVKYSISMVCYNHVDLTIKCLESVMKHFGKSKDFEILIVNNNSTDGTKKYLNDFKELYQNNLNVQIVHSTENKGFMTPQNYNASISVGKYLVVLNNDLEVCAGWLDKMEEPFLKNSNMAIVGLKQNPGAFDEHGSGYVNGDIEYIEMSCAMIRNDLVKKYGLFDDKILEFGYCEDADFSLRLRERGYDIATVQLPIKHHRSSTMGKLDIDIQGYEAKNKYFLRQRWDRYFKTRNFEYKILLKRRGAIGDEILATGVAHRLREKYPLSKITMQSKFPEVWSRNPDINFVDIHDEVDDRLFDLFFDLDMSYEKEPKNHIIDIYSKVCDVSNEKDLYLYPNSVVEERIKRIYGDNKIAIFHCEMHEAWQSRKLPIDKLIYAADYLHKLGFKILEIGHKYYLKSDIHYQDTNFDSLISLIKNAKIFVGVDSGPFHIAQTFKIPSVIAFGSIDPKYRVTNFKLVKPVIVDWLKCLGCHHWQEAPRIHAAKCVRKKHYCMTMITNDMMKISIDKAIQEIK
jgi:GT2 family glycosyltransferase/ADP-heptose:LPS heptosyltransferase